MASLTYPITRYAPPEIVDLTSKDGRKRLSASGLKALFNIAECWKLRSEEVRELLGGVANGSYFEMKKNPSSRFSMPTRCTAFLTWSGSSRP